MTDTIWYIIHIIVATVAFAVGLFIAAEIREWRDNTRNIEREIPFSLFLEAYGKAPDRWTLLPYYVRYGADDVRFENYSDYRKYKKWREKRKRDAEEARKRSVNERLFREIQSDLMTPPPTIVCYCAGAGVSYEQMKNIFEEYLPPSIVYYYAEADVSYERTKEILEAFAKIIEHGEREAKVKTGTNEETKQPNPSFTPPPTIYKPTKSADLREEIKKYAERDDDVRVDGAKLVPQPAEFCGDCPWASGNYPDVAICGNDHHAHLRSERCKYRKQAVLKPMKAEVCGICGICRQFDKGDNSPFGYCFRNDEIVNEASVKGCFEPKSKAEERPEPLGTAATH